MMNTREDMVLNSLLGDYPSTSLFVNGEIKSEQLNFNFADAASPSKLFPKVVRDLQFDFAELAIVTYLTAKANSIPVVLLPVVVKGKFQHESLVCAASRPALRPADLAGRRIGIRSHSVTTVTWVRGILQNDYGVDLDSIRWVTFQDAHVAQVSDPASFERAPSGKNPMDMLFNGELDAAVMTGKDLKDPRVQPVIPDPDAAAEEWYDKYGVVPINHMVVVKKSLSESDPQAVKEIFRLLVESKKNAGLPAGTGHDSIPIGLESMRKGLEMIIKYAYQQRLIPEEYAVEDLFDDVTRALTVA